MQLLIFWYYGIYCRLTTFRDILDGKLQLTWVSFSNYDSSGYPFQTPSSMTGSCAHIPRAACTQLMRVTGGKTVTIFQILGSCALITDCCFWLQTCTENEYSIIVAFLTMAPPSLKQTSSLSTKMTSSGFKGQVLFLPHHSFISFPPFWSQTLKIKTCKSNIYGENYEVITYARERHVETQKTLSFGTETTKKKKINKQTDSKTQKTLEKEEILISRVTRLLHSVSSF